MKNWAKIEGEWSHTKRQTKRQKKSCKRRKWVANVFNSCYFVDWCDANHTDACTEPNNKFVERMKVPKLDREYITTHTHSHVEMDEFINRYVTWFQVHAYHHFYISNNQWDF